MKKKILYFFPANPLRSNAGNVTRSRALLRYFKLKGYTVHYIYSNDRWGGEISDPEIEDIKRSGLAEKVFKIQKKPSRKDKLDYFFSYRLPSLPRKFLSLFKEDSLPDYSGFYTRKLFDEVLERDQYDYIIISYVFWGNLIKDNPLLKGAKTIIDTHDFATSLQQTEKKFDLGQAFSDEIKRLDLFDEVWAISPEEQYIFSQFMGSKVLLIPFTIDVRSLSGTNHFEKEYDLIYVAGDNPHNVRAAKWFFTNVYPELKTGITMLVVGKICSHIGSYENVKKIPFVEDLDVYYKNAKVAVCPMLSGTGVKIKVLEALSYGLPVVCSMRGIDGLRSKLENGCLVSYSASEFVQNIHRLLEDEKLYEITSSQGKHYIDIAHSTNATYHVLDKSLI